MPNLKNWIEAQLKRGYTRKQIRDILISKGYSPAAVAELDKIGVIKTSQKTNNQKPSYSIVVLLLAAALLIVIVIFIYNSYQGVEEQGTIEKTAKQEISEEGLENAEKSEAMENKGEPKKFENYVCGSSLPENIRSMPVEEYILSYNIDGSKGENVKWLSSEQPLAIFSPFEGPKIFSVYDNNTFEGCGYLEKLENKDKNNQFKNEVKSQLRLCEGKEIYLKQKNEDDYNELGLYYFKSEEEIIHLTIFAVLPFNDEATILSNLGCEV